jgi:hypothetical protein
MKKFWLIFSIVLANYQILFAQLMAERVVQKNKVGFQDLKEKKLVIPCEYEDAETYAVGNNIAVKKNGKWGLINENNKVLIPFEYEMIYSTCDQTTSAKKNGKWGVIDINSNAVIIPFEYEETGKTFYNKILGIKESQTFTINNPVIVVKQNGRWKFIKKDTKSLMPFTFEDVDVDCGEIFLEIGDAKMIMRGKRNSLPYIKFEGEWYEPRYNEEKESFEFVETGNAKIYKRGDYAPNPAPSKK